MSRIERHGNVLHFYLDDGIYLGMLTLSGQLSDFRAIVRNNAVRLDFGDSVELRKTIRREIFSLLNAWLDEQTECEVKDREKTKKLLVDTFLGDLDSIVEQLVLTVPSI